MTSLAVIELLGIALAGVGVGWFVHPGAGLAVAGGLLFVETFFEERRRKSDDEGLMVL